MSLRPLRLNVKRAAWRAHDPHSEKADHAFDEVRVKVIERDHERCVFCGFSAYAARPKNVSTLLQVHHVDDDHHNNAPTNLLTCDSLCHAYAHIGFAGTFDGARLVVLPEVPAGVFNVLQRAMWAVRQHAQTREDDGLADATLSAVTAQVEQWEELITERMSHTERMLGTGMSQPAILASLMRKCRDAEYEEVSTLIDAAGLRLAHQAAPHAHEIEASTSPAGCFSALHPSSWRRLLTEEVVGLWQTH